MYVSTISPAVMVDGLTDEDGIDSEFLEKPYIVLQLWKAVVRNWVVRIAVFYIFM